VRDAPVVLAAAPIHSHRSSLPSELAPYADAAFARALKNLAEFRNFSPLFNK
jgi:hypothetical protein